jgi:hypothetical protein
MESSVRRPLDGSRPEETIYTNDAYTFCIPIDWSPDGKYLSMHMSTREEAFSDWSLPLNGGKAFRPAATAQLKASEYEGRFSFDSRWLTYFSYETGRPGAALHRTTIRWLSHRLLCRCSPFKTRLKTLPSLTPECRTQASTSSLHHDGHTYRS